MISKYLYFSILINYWFLCKGLLYSPFSKTLSKSYCTPCSNNDDDEKFFNCEWENKDAINAYEKSVEYFKNISNITKNNVKR